MKTLILAALAAIATPVAAEAQTRGVISVQIGNEPRYQTTNPYTNPYNYLYCLRPNGKTGIVTDQYNRPVSRYSYNYYGRNYLQHLRCTKIRYNQRGYRY